MRAGLTRRLRLLRGLTPREGWTLLRVAPTVCGYRAALHIVPFRRLAGRALRERNPTGTAPRARRDDREALDEISNGVSAVASLLKGTTTCLVQALAVVDLARQRGIAAELCIGVAKAGADDVVGIEGHAWVELDGEVVHGASERDYRRFPSIERLIFA
jgi:hypothetical protein